MQRLTSGNSRCLLGPAQRTRHALIGRTAKIVDLFVDTYKKIRTRRSFPHKEVKTIIAFLFPGSAHKGRGAFKSAFLIRSRAKALALKTANPKHIARDMRIYEKLPRTLRNRYFAKIYWQSKYCLLQKYGKAAKVPKETLEDLRRFAKRHGLTDVRPDNVRKVDGRFKIVDANISKRRK